MLVISIRAGGRGLNLPAANHVFHFDRWWNPAVEQQATDRAYRFGQRKDVYVHSLICTATLEERIDELLDSKREFAEKVVAGRADDWLGELDLDAIRAAVSLSETTRRGGGMMVLNEGRPVFVGGDGDRIGRGPWARWLATSIVPDEELAARRARPNSCPHRPRPQRDRRRASRSRRGRSARRAPNTGWPSPPTLSPAGASGPPSSARRGAARSSRPPPQAGSSHSSSNT